MEYNRIFQELSRNKNVIKHLLSATGDEERIWRPEPGKWCLLEIICHLLDEEREDFRARLEHVLDNPELPLPPIDPPAWVEERQYMQQDYSQTLEKFINEREQSVAWLLTLKNPAWDNSHEHPKFGPMSAKMFLSNWLAHDYLHIRQIIKLKFDHLKHISGEELNYAGEW